MRGLAVVVIDGLVISVGMRGVIMRVAGIVMLERHALPRCHGRHALERNRQGEERDGKDPQDRATHRVSLYAG